MDPELTEQLNESMRQLSEMIAQLNSTMAGTVSSMKSVSDAGKNAANTTKQNADRQTASTNQVVGGQTKLQEAHQQAGEKIDKASAQLRTAFSTASNAATSFGRALISTETGFKKYGSAVETAGDAAFQLGKNFGIIGTVLGGAVKGITFFASEALAMHDTMIQLNRDITSFAGVIPGTVTEFANLAKEAGYAGQNMAKMAKFVQGLGQNVVALGNTAGEGAVKFAKIANVGDDVKKIFGRLGYSQEQLTEMQSYYIRQQALSGQSLALNTKSEERLRKESLGYVENLVKMSTITGQNAEDAQREREAVKSQIEEQIKVRQEELLAQKLDAEGRHAEARQIREDAAARSAIMENMTTMYGQEVGAMVGRVLRTGSFDEFSSGLAAMGLSVEDIQGKMKTMGSQLATTNDQEKRNQILTQGSFDVADKYNKGLDNFATTVGDAAQYSKELPGAFGATSDAMLRSNLAIGKSASERLSAAEKAIAEEKAKKDKAEEQRLAQEKADRDFQAQWQDSMLALADRINPYVTKATEMATSALKALNNFIFNTLLPNLETVKNVFLGLVGVAVLGKVISAFGGLTKVISGIGSAFSWLSGKIKSLFGFGGAGSAQRAARAAIDDSQLLDKNGKPLRGAAREARAAKLAREAAAATSAPARTGILGKAGGMLGKAGGMLGKAGKLIPGVGWLMTAGMAAAGGVSAYNDAANVMGIKGRDATTGEKLTAGAAGALSSLTFGLVDTKTIAGGLSKTFEVLGSVMGPVIETGKSVVSTVFSPFVSTGKLIAENWDAIYSTGASIVETVFSPFLAVGRLITENWESIYSIGKSMVGVIGDLIKIAFYPLIAVGRLIKNNWDSIVSVGKQVVNVVFWPFIQVGKVVYNNWDKIASAFKTGLGYLASFWGKIKDFTGWLSSWLGGDDEEKPDEEKPDEEKPAPATPQKELPKPEPAKTEEETTDRPGVAPKEDETAISESTFTTATRDLVTTQQENEETNQGVRSEQNKAFSDIVKRFDESVVQTTKNTKINTNAISDFSSSNRLFQKLTNTFNLTVNSFSQSISSFVLAVKDFGDKISQMALGTGQTGPGANAPATVEAAMQMQFQKESGGGKMLRAQGFKHAGTMGGAYGLGDGARKSAYDSMNKQERAEFLAKTGFAKAPTLNDLVSKDGKSFLSDQARVADEMLARKFTMNTIQSLNQKLGRAPTMADVRGAHWLGEGGYVALLKAAAENPNMTMRDFWKPSWGSVDLKQFPPTVGEMIAKIAEQAGGFGGGTLGNSADIVALGKQLQGMGIRVSEHPEFKPFNPKGHAGRAHAEGRALDLNVVDGRDVDDTRAAQIFDNLKPQLMSQGYSVLWRVGGHYDHMHVQKGADGIKPGTDGIVAAKGGVFEGSREGYPATLHGTELVAPLNVDSILMKMAKTPATAAEPTEQENTKISGFVEPAKLVEQLMSKDNEMLMLLSSKLDQMIDALENSNDTQSKILKHSRI